MKLITTKQEPVFQADSIRSQVYAKVAKAGKRGAAIERLKEEFDGAVPAIRYLIRRKYLRTVQ